MWFIKAVNKLAEIMNRKGVAPHTQRGRKVNESDMRKKEKECRKLEQELKQVGIYYQYIALHRSSEKNMLIIFWIHLINQAQSVSLIFIVKMCHK